MRSPPGGHLIATVAVKKGRHRRLFAAIPASWDSVYEVISPLSALSESAQAIPVRKFLIVARKHLAEVERRIASLTALKTSSNE
jgi:hypothetical protein